MLGFQPLDLKLTCGWSNDQLNFSRDIFNYFLPEMDSNSWPYNQRTTNSNHLILQLTYFSLFLELTRK